MHGQNPPAKAALRAESLCFSYGKRRIVQDLSFSVAPGECAVLAGPNGSGKSTVLSLAAGVLRPTSGTVTAGGRIGYVPQGTALLTDATVEENLRFFADLAHADVPAHLPFAVEAYRKQRISALSGGMQKQVSIACAMIGDPQILLLDEPCAALDISFRAEMIALVRTWRQEGRTVLYAAHDPAEVFLFCDTLIFMGEAPAVRSRREHPALGESEAAFAQSFVQLFDKAKSI